MRPAWIALCSGTTFIIAVHHGVAPSSAAYDFFIWLLGILGGGMAVVDYLKERKAG